MEPIDEFRDFGKKLPYREPTGFFDQISEKTLEHAKQREQSHKKIMVLWRTVAVAASLSALALLGYFMLEPEKIVKNPVALDKQPIDQQFIPKQEIIKQPKVAEMKEAVQGKVPEKIDAKEIDTEDIGDVLADLTDEELSQLEAMYKTDLFISESEK